METEQKMGFFEITQNNSWWGFDVDDKLCHRMIVEAKDISFAKDILEWYWVYFNWCDSWIDCECCGDRWSEDSIDEVNIDEIKKDWYMVELYDSPWVEKDYSEKFWEFPSIEKPTFKTREWWTKVYEGKIYFDTIEQYAKFMAIKWWWTTTDTRIFFS